jgi:hypothetical protein
MTDWTAYNERRSIQPVILFISKLYIFREIIFLQNYDF